MKKDEILKIIKEELLKEKKRLKIIKRLNELDESLNKLEEASNLPPGYKEEDFFEEPEIDGYTFYEDEIRISFKKIYDDLTVYMDSLVSYIENKYNMKYQEDEQLENIIDHMISMGIFEKYLKEYIFDHMDELELSDEEGFGYDH